MTKQQDNARRAAQLPELRWGWVWFAATLLLALTITAVWGLIAFARRGAAPSQVSAELAAVRTALTVTVGGGGAFALWLAARRQRSAEIQLHENARIAQEVREHEAAVAKANEADAKDRRVTELYSTAVEQLGSEKAAVRLGGLYALERLARQNPEHRLTIIKVICAYLRMPFGVSTRLEERESGRKLMRIPGNQEKSEELQVRFTAQEILGNFMRRSPQDDPETEDGEITEEYRAIQLSGATLVNFRMLDCNLHFADFSGAHFLGITSFRFVDFGSAHFAEATFSGRTLFERCKFRRHSTFHNISTERVVSFEKVEFDEMLGFIGMRAKRSVSFEDVTFKGRVAFSGPSRKSGSQSFLSNPFTFSECRVEAPPEVEPRLPPGWGVNDGVITRGD